ncbi:23231_t:CDS:1, partial [Gigaspora rosea]
PFEPVVHGTFGIVQPKPLDMFIDQIRDFFAEITAGSRGFGHPDYDGFVPY